LLTLSLYHQNMYLKPEGGSEGTGASSLNCATTLPFSRSALSPRTPHVTINTFTQNRPPCRADVQFHNVDITRTIGGADDQSLSPPRSFRCEGNYFTFCCFSKGWNQGQHTGKSHSLLSKKNCQQEVDMHTTLTQLVFTSMPEIQDLHKAGECD
jgi:hypothetical protein